MSARSEKARMREALRTTEGNLSSLLGVRYKTGLTSDSNVDVAILTIWRDVVRKALGTWVPSAQSHFATDATPAKPMTTTPPRYRARNGGQ